MLAWLMESTVGRLLQTFFISMVPVAELRVGIPYGVSLGLDYHAAAAAAVLGNLFPVPVIIAYLRQVFKWLRKKKAQTKGEKVRRYGTIGLILLVAIPLPGTGAWTGALVAAVLGLHTKNALPAIAIGVLIAAVIVIGLTLGVSYIL